MIILTKGQRTALKRVFDLRPLYILPDGIIKSAEIGSRLNLECDVWLTAPLATYRQFRRTVQPALGCIMVPWCGMWLGIEPDGYTHS